MVIPVTIAQKLDYLAPYVRFVGEKVKDKILRFCEVNGFAFTSRYKSKESITEKIETGRFKSWYELEDFFACKIIVPTLRREQQAIDFLRTEFLEQTLKKRGSTLKDPNVFRFDATRFVGRLNPHPGADTNPVALNIPFEVQILSAFEHAWSVATHEIAYKGENIDWKNLRLSAQLKASVEQLDSLILGFSESAKHISEHQWPDVTAQKNIERFFKERIRSNKIPPELTPSNWGRFCSNIYSLFKLSAFQAKGAAFATRASLKILASEFDSTPSDKLPLSISLSQITLGFLVRGKAITPPIKCFPLITQELFDIFPELRAFDKEEKFKIEI